MIPSARPAPTVSRRLSDGSKAAVFSVMLLTLALAAGLLIRALDPPQVLAYIIWGSTPLVAVLIMMFVISDGVWPASIAHGVHNASWGALAALTVTGSAVLVNEYLAGDTGVFILITTIVAAFWLRRWLRQHPGKES